MKLQRNFANKIKQLQGKAVASMPVMQSSDNTPFS